MMLKRLFDIFISLLGLVLLLPIFIAIILSIKCTSNGPVIFGQKRVGLNGKIFKLYKFRTMVINAEEVGLKITVGKDRRITKSGHYLRRFKLDELPQLLNVFLGDMSLVGPRPEVVKYVELYPLSIKNKILSVKPGITDWASIAMIDENTLLAQETDPEKMYIEKILPQKLTFSLKYIDTRNFWQDIKIIFITLIKIFRR